MQVAVGLTKPHDARLASHTRYHSPDLSGTVKLASPSAIVVLDLQS